MILYHGTTKENAKKLLENGWTPNSGTRGSNFGNSRYLYVTNIPENALWFAEQKGDDVVLAISDLNYDILKVDPEDGIYETVEEELKHSANSKMPAYLVVVSPISKDKIKIHSGSL